MCVQAKYLATRNPLKNFAQWQSPPMLHSLQHIVVSVAVCLDLCDNIIMITMTINIIIMIMNIQLLAVNA